MVADLEGPAKAKAETFKIDLANGLANNSQRYSHATALHKGMHTGASEQ